MAIKIYRFITSSWSWLPTSIIGMVSLCICIKFGDSLLGIIDRAWKVIGR